MHQNVDTCKREEGWTGSQLGPVCCPANGRNRVFRLSEPVTYACHVRLTPLSVSSSDQTLTGVFRIVQCDLDLITVLRGGASLPQTSPALPV